MRTLIFAIPTAAGTLGGLLLSCYLVHRWSVPEVEQPALRTAVVLLGWLAGTSVAALVDIWYRAHMRS